MKPRGKAQRNDGKMAQQSQFQLMRHMLPKAAVNTSMYDTFSTSKIALQQHVAKSCGHSQSCIAATGGEIIPPQNI
jgi:hypothetical protein